MTTYQDILDKLRQSQLMQKFNANKQAMTNPQPSGFGHGIANLGMKMSQSQIPQIAKLGVGTQTLGNKLGALGAAKGLGSAGGALGNAGAMGGAAGALGKATPFLGGAMSGAQAAQDASKGDYIGAGLNGIAAGASFVPGVGTAVSMGAQALDSINKMFRSAKDKANAKAMQEGMQAMQQNEQTNAQDTAAQQQAFQDASEQAAQNMTQPSTYDAMKTQLPVGQEIDYQVAKANSPFANDSGYDYDLRGAYQRLGGLNPEATNGHLSDYDKLPIHPTFSTDSKFYNGQDYAINPETYTYPEEQEIGTLTGGAANPTTTPQSTGQSIIDKLRSGLGDFRAGFDDNAQHGFMQGDLANKFAGTQTQQQPVTPSPYELLANDMTAANFSPEQIEAAKQGLNGGNADIAALVDKYSINKPTTDEEIALAQAGNLNPQDTTGSAAPLQGNVAKKSIMNRIGEAFGTGRRLLSNPWVQAGIAGAITKATGGTTGDALTNAYNYGKEKQMADYYYKQMNPGATVTPILNNFGTTDYKNQADIENANAKLQEQMYNNAFTRQLNQEKFDFDKDYKNKKYDLDERKFKEYAAYHKGQLGLQQQRLQIALANAGNKKERDRLLNDYKKQIQSDVADYITVPKKDKAGYKKYIVDKYGVDVLKYLNQADAKSGNSKSSNYSTQENYVDNEDSLYSNLPDWFYKDYEEED